MPDGFRVPSAGFNAVYQLVHIYRHLFTEGIVLNMRCEIVAVVTVRGYGLWMMG